MDNQTSLEDALSGSASDTPNTAPTEATTTPEPQATPEPASIEPAPQAQATAEPIQAKPAVGREERGLIRAAQEERRKRQDLERELETLRQQTMPAQADYSYQDPQVQVQRQVEQVQQQVRGTLTSMSEEMARRAYPDFQEKLEAYESELAKNPSLLSVITGSELPGEAVYQKGKEILIKRQYGDSEETILAAAEKKLRPKIEADLLAKLKGKNNQPTNILHKRAASGDTSPDWRPVSIHEVFGKKR